MVRKKYIRRKIEKEFNNVEWPSDVLAKLKDAVAYYQDKKYKYIRVGITSDMKQSYDSHRNYDPIHWTKMVVKYKADNYMDIQRIISDVTALEEWAGDKVYIPETLFDEMPPYYVYVLVGKRMKSKRMIEKNKYNVLELFCGCGGLSKGFIDAGFKVKLGIDVDDQALKSFEKNHDGAKAMHLDLFNLDNVSEIIKYFESENCLLDVLVGGPPCQGFSLAGPRQIDDSRNKLYRAMVKTAELMRPKVVVLENVPGMIQLHGGLVKDKIISDFTNLGYKMGEPKILYAPDYGVPQIRKRVVFVGLLNSDKEFEYPVPILAPQNYVTCEDAIGDLPALIDIVGEPIQDYPSCENLTEYQMIMRKGSDKIHNHEGTIHDPKTKKFIAMVPEGKNYKSLPPEYDGIYKYHEALTRYHSKKPSPTINTGHRSHFHYKWDRIPTVRESARLQSFPDTFIFYGNKTQQYRQVGNAVPPLLGKAIAKEILKWLNERIDEKN